MPRKAKNNEEVKVEKKFCTKCGKELGENEVCDCTKEEVAVSVNTDVIVDYVKNVVNTIIGMFKKPMDTLDERIKENKLRHNMILLVAMAISFALFITGSFSTIMNFLSILYQRIVDAELVVPYFKIFVFSAIIKFILLFIPIAMAFLGIKIFSDKKLSFKDMLALYAVSFSPMILCYLVMFITNYFSILGIIGKIFGVVVYFACLFNFMLKYIKMGGFKENTQAYVLTSVTLASLVLIFAVTSFFLSNFTSNIIKDGYNNSYYDINNW